MKLKFLLVCFLVSVVNGCHNVSSTRSTSSLEIHYAPDENLETLDASAIDQAKHTIDICAYDMTDYALGDALLRANTRGVKVRIYLDRGQTTGELNREERTAQKEDVGEVEAAPGVLQRLAAANNIEMRVKHSKTLMHLKTYAIDESLLRTGSANFSPTGEKRQDNDLIFIRDIGAIARFHSTFEVVWARPDNEALTIELPDKR